MVSNYDCYLQTIIFQSFSCTSASWSQERPQEDTSKFDSLIFPKRKKTHASRLLRVDDSGMRNAQFASLLGEFHARYRSGRRVARDRSRETRINATSRKRARYRAVSPRCSHAISIMMRSAARANAARQSEMLLSRVSAR